jgi:hypothetical protein
MRGRKPHEVAATEAHQEAGVRGVIRKESVGVYHYTKMLPNGEDRLCVPFCKMCRYRAL